MEKLVLQIDAPQLYLSTMQHWSHFMVALTLLYLSSFGDASREVKHLGCMKRTAGSKSFSEKVQMTEVHIKTCVIQCWERRKKFAGLQNGNMCVCSASLADVVAVAKTECHKRCNKNCQQLCGGEKALSVYQTGYKREPVFPMKPDALIKANIGCYHKYRSLKVLCPKNFAPIETIRMTVALCVYYCASVHQAKFSTTTDKQTCCCSNSVSGAHNRRLRYCNMHCKGDTAKKDMGCMGLRRGELLVSTIQLSRLPEFKRWPPSVFTNADWLAPLFLVGENFEIKEKPLVAMEDDPSLSGLLAKRLVVESSSGNVSAAVAGVALLGDKAVVSLAGADQRDKTLGGVGKSVAISEVSGKAEAAAPTNDEGKGLIIGAVVVAFVIIIIATGFYFYKNSDTDEDEDEDEGEVKKRKRRKKKRTRTSDDDDDEDDLI